MPRREISGMKTLLALLYAPGKTDIPSEEIYGRTKVEKLLFILKERGFPIADYDFEAYDYGPCSLKLYDDLEVLALYDWIKIKPWKYGDVIEVMDAADHLDAEELPKDKKVDIFSLTSKGLDKGRRAFESLPQEMQKIIIDVKKEFNSKSLLEILRYIYKKYPKYAEKSLIKDKILAESKFGAKKDIPSFRRGEE